MSSTVIAPTKAVSDLPGRGMIGTAPPCTPTPAGTPVAVLLYASGPPVRTMVVWVPSWVCQAPRTCVGQLQWRP